MSLVLLVSNPLKHVLLIGLTAYILRNSSLKPLSICKLLSAGVCLDLLVSRRNTQSKSTVYGGKRYDVNAIAPFSQKSFAMQNLFVNLKRVLLIFTVISSGAIYCVVEKSRNTKYDTTYN